MRVAEQLEVLYLALDAALHIAADEVLARDDLQGDLLAGAAVHGQLDLAEAALAERLDDVVGADALLGARLLAERGAVGISGAMVGVGRGRGRGCRGHDGGVDGGGARGRGLLVAGLGL